jgi:hypothetical protein
MRKAKPYGRSLSSTATPSAPSRKAGFDASPEGMRYLCYTEQGTLNSYTAEELVKEFYDPRAVQEVLEKYVK